MNPNVEPLKVVADNMERAGKPTVAEVMAKVNELGAALRVVIVEVKSLPRTPGLDPHQDTTRSLALAQSHLQTGFMWLRRAIDNPNVF